MSPSARQIEREVEASRANLEETVEALKDKMSIGQIVDEAARYFDDTGGSRLVSNLGAQIRDNPLPLVLVGVGLAWLMSGRGHPHVRARYAYGAGFDREIDPSDPARYGEGLQGSGSERESYSSDGGNGALNQAGRAAQRVGETVAGAAGAVASGLGSAASGIAGAAAGIASGVGSTATAAGDAVSAGARRMRHAGGTAWRGGSAAYQRASRMGAGAYEGASHIGEHARRGFSSVRETDPLVLGAVGLAVGAAIGAMLPASETEDRLLGEQSDRLREEAREFAREKYEQGRTVAKEAYRTAKTEAEAQGLAPTGEGGLTDRVEQVARATVKRVRKTAAKEGLMPGSPDASRETASDDASITDRPLGGASGQGA
jgi:hypothetical protein